MLTVVAVDVKNNINRVYRTCYSMGVSRLWTIRCGAIRGGLYSAKNNVSVTEAISDDIPQTSVWMECNGDVAAERLDWFGVTHLVIGGESTTLPKRACYARAKLPTVNRLRLTSEGALAMALLLYRLPTPARLRYVGYGLYASPLPLRREVLAMTGHIKTWIDLTQRPRHALEMACADARIDYKKVPTGYEDTPEMPDVTLPAVVSCFHGRDRTQRFVSLWRRSHADR